ncbi:MAG: glycosyltransferase [Bacteroidota bacterium]|nr:glycosyltransferase [Bacteroidota bacterium]
MPKVLRIINRFNLGGPTYNVAYLSKYMAPEFETLLIGGKNAEYEGASDYIVKNLGLHPIIIPEMQREINYRNDYLAYQKIRDIIKRWNPDIVHTHATKAGVLGRLAAHRLKVPVIVHTYHGHIYHSYFNKPKTAIYKQIDRNLAKKTTRIIAISEQQKQELVFKHKIAAAKNFNVIPLGFDLERFQQHYQEKRSAFRRKYNIAVDTLTIGIVGRLTKVKNHALFLDAFAKTKSATHKKVKAFIIGDGELKNQLIKHAAHLGLSVSMKHENTDSDIIFTSWIKEIDLVYPGLDIACLTSINEGTPVSLIEAQAANTPVVTTNVGGIENTVIPGKTALLAQNKNLNDYTAKLLLMVNDDNLRKNMAQEGWVFVKSNYDFNRLVNDMKSLYNHLLT